MRFQRRRDSLSVFTPFPRDAASPIRLLSGSGSLYRRPLHPIHRQTLVGGKSLHLAHAL